MQFHKNFTLTNFNDQAFLELIVGSIPIAAPIDVGVDNVARMKRRLFNHHLSLS